MESSRICLLVIFLICAVPRRSDGSFHELLRQLAQRVDNFSDPAHVMPPSPSPLPSLDAPSPLTRPEKLTCDNASYKCDIQNYSVTACVPFVGYGGQASYVVVINGDESSLQLNIVVRPANVTVEGLEISGHQVMKVDLPANTRGDSSILLNVGNGDCTIHLQQGSYTSYISLTNATYLLFGAALFIGGSWACCNTFSSGGIPYQELQMERRDANTFVVGDWDQNWDGQWDIDDEEKALISPATIHNRKGGSENDG